MRPRGIGFGKWVVTRRAAGVYDVERAPRRRAHLRRPARPALHAPGTVSGVLEAMRRELVARIGKKRFARNRAVYAPMMRAAAEEIVEMQRRAEALAAALGCWGSG